MKIRWICIIIIVLINLTGCSAQRELTLEGNLMNYDLGEGTLTDSNGRTVPYRIQGVLGIPDGKNCPIVVLIHGAHPIEKASESRYDTGFNYITQALSQQGNLVISMNVAINYSFENGEPNGNERMRQITSQQLLLLKKAVEGDKKVFGYDLSGIGDFSRIIFMGHSRGGLDVLECAENLPEGMHTIGAVSVAPSTYKTWETPLPNIPVGIIIPQMDGDVISLDGSDIYEAFISDEQYTNTTELIYLKNANHGYFNTQLTQPDLNHTEADLTKLMPAEQQRIFLANYLSDFVKNVTTTGQMVFASEALLPSTAYDCDILLRAYSGTEKILWSAEDSSLLTCNGDATAVQEIDSYFPARKTIQTFQMPTLSLESYALWHIIWTGTDSSVIIPIFENRNEYRFCDIDMAIDSTDPANANGQSMTLFFKDEAGNTAVYQVDSGEAAMLWQEGELKEQDSWDGKTEQVYSTFTPLVTLRIDLSKLQGIELEKVISLQMSWNGSESGSIMLRSIRGVI